MSIKRTEGTVWQVRRIWLLLGGVACLFGQPSCSGKDQDEVLRQWIGKGALLAQGHDVGGLMQMTSEDFSAWPGERGRQEVRGILFVAFRHYGRFRILYPEPRVDLDTSGEEASVKVYFLIVKEDRTYPNLHGLYKDPKRWIEEVGRNADLYRLEIACVKKKGDWVARRALLEPYKGYGFGEPS